MTQLEKGREVPTLEMLDTLAGALNVPVYMFFFDMPEPESTPRLTPRPPLHELAEEWQGPATLRSNRAPRGTWLLGLRRTNLLVASFLASFR